jgi:hypothetical protein
MLIGDALRAITATGTYEVKPRPAADRWCRSSVVASEASGTATAYSRGGLSYSVARSTVRGYREVLRRPQLATVGPTPAKRRPKIT